MANLKDIGYGVGKYLEASDASDIPGIGNNRKNLDLLNFKIATNNAYGLYNFKDGMIDAYQDQTGVDTATSTGETYDSTTKTYNTSDPTASTGFTVTGSLQTFTVPAGVTSVEIKCWGASGNTADAGNGGFSKGNLSTSGGTQYAVVVGEQTADPNSNTYSDTPYGGGGRGYNQTSAGGLSGVYTGTGAISFTSTTDQARAIIIAGGGGGRGGFGNTWGGVGGGLGAAGSGTFSFPAANIATTDSSYENQSYKSGIGGTQSSAGSYPGMNSGSVMKGGDGQTGNEDPGGGGGYYGGAGGSAATGGGGGSGYVGSQNGLSSGATYYAWDGSPSGTMTKKSDPDWPGNNVAKVLFKYSLVNDISLVSNTQTAIGDDPTEGRLMLYEEDVDSITLNTDIKGYVSRDGGTNWAQTTLVEDTVYNLFGADDYNKLLLHCDGSNGGTTFTDSSNSAHTVTKVDDAHTDTAIKKFGTASLQLPHTGSSNGDYLYVAPSDDWKIGTGDYTWDLWVNFGSVSGTRNIINQNDVNMAIKYASSNLTVVQASTSINFAWTPSTDTWYHLAVTRSSGSLRVFVDGTQIGSTTSATQNITGTAGNAYLYIGNTPSSGVGVDQFLGYMDEIRFSLGIARWTANFTPPNVPYGNPQRLLSGSVDISGQPSGTDMKYKVTTHNEKNLKLHGASLLWA